MQCEVDDLSIWYEIIGDGPAILMLHGFMLDHRHMFETLEPVFRIHSHWKRIYLDLPGMGNTKSNPKVKNSDDVLERVLQFIDKILPEQPLLIVGTSYGGYLARGILYRRPMQVRGLLLMVPCIIPDMTKRTLPKHEILLRDPILSQQISKQEREYFNDLVMQTPQVWEKYKRNIIPAIQKADMEYCTRWQKEGYAFSEDIDEKLPESAKSCCASIITGRQDSVCGFLDAWKLIHKYPHATFAVLDNAGHDLEWEQEELVQSLIKEWLNRYIVILNH